MKLIMVIPDFDGDYELTCFEHIGPVEAQWEIRRNIDNWVKCNNIPENFSLELGNYSNDYYDFFHDREHVFSFCGFKLPYSMFLNLESVFDQDVKKCKLVIIQYDIISLKDWFDSRRRGDPWPNRLNSLIKDNL
jgi:hypothetical protein